jgi:hypothetical protein
MAYIWKEDTTFLPIIYFGPLYENYIEMAFFPRLQSGSLEISKLWVF